MITNEFVIRTVAGEKLTTIKFSERDKDKMLIEAQLKMAQWLSNAPHLIQTSLVIKEEFSS